jgi:protein O-GlcNAc transferase
MNEAISAEGSGDFRLTERICLDDVAANPSDAAAAKRLGLLSLRMGVSAELAFERLKHAWLLNSDSIAVIAAFIRAAIAIRQRGIAHAVLEHARARGKNDVSTERWLLSLHPPVDPARVARGHVDVSDWWLDRGMPDAAIWHLERALSIQPDWRSAFARLYNIHALNARFDAAERAARAILKLRPDFYDGYVLLGAALCGQAKRDEGIAVLQHAITLHPERSDARSRMLFEMNHDPNFSRDQKFLAAADYGRVVSQSIPSRYESWHSLRNTSPLRLRVGLLSPDLHSHPVGYFLESVMCEAIGFGVEFYVYHAARQEDALTARLKKFAAKWTNVALAEDDAIAASIYGDAVAVLVDLSGHAPFNRLRVFAYRPAPIQVTWLGYFATTGMQEIDYILVDAASVSAEEQRFFTEKLWFLPSTRLCFSVPEAAPEVSSLPAVGRGYVTFGSFQTIGKMTTDVLEVWSQVLAAIPASRLRLQSALIGNHQFLNGFKQRLLDCGIALDRVELVASTTRADYLAAHSEVDIILDTFPYQGGTTTCEALWMGVPTVTLRGHDMPSRQGASIMCAAGLEDWIADDTSGFVAIAVAAAQQLDRLEQLRRTLRTRVIGSSLMDASSFARGWVAALQKMWAYRVAASVDESTIL